jgi:hypothetical protein
LRSSKGAPSKTIEADDGELRCSAERSTASKETALRADGIGLKDSARSKWPALDDQSARRRVHEIENPETAAAVNVLQPRRKTAIDNDPTQSDDSMPFFGQCCRRCHGVDGAEKYRPASKTLGKGISSSPCRRLEPGRDAIYESSLAKKAGFVTLCLPGFAGQERCVIFS